MIVFFIVLTIMLLISLIFFMLCLSDIEIEIKKLVFDSENKKRKKLQVYNTIIRIKLFNKFTWLKFKIDNNKIIKIKKSKFINNKIYEYLNDITKLKEIILKNKKEFINLNILKELNLDIKKLDLEIKLSVLDSIMTSFSVAIISSIIAILLAKNIKTYNRNKYNYIVTPIYEYKPIFKIKLNCIISVKIVHIMNIIYILIKKRSVEYDERASNRRTYVCGND